MLDIDNIKGVIPPIVTPVYVHENIDPNGLKRVIDHVIDGGVHGVFVLGSHGEFYGLDFKKQKQAIEITVEHVNGRVPVYAGASAITTKECIKLSALAEKLGADAVTANVAPKLVVEIYDRFSAGDFNGALEAQNKLIPLRNAYGYGSFPVVMKDCLNLLGLDIGHPVKPINHCSVERMEALKIILTELNLMK